MDRAHRLGQKRAVNVYRLLTRGTLEERIMGLQVSCTPQALGDSALCIEAWSLKAWLTWTGMPAACIHEGSSAGSPLTPERAGPP